MKKLLFLTLLCCYSQLIYAQVKPTEIPLYENQIPNEKPGKDEETSTTENNILLFRDVRNPTLSVFLPPKEKANGTAVVICPGGGYWVVAAGHEGYDVARKFNEMGIAAFVLKYRLPDPKVSTKPEIAPLQDAQQALRLVRKNAKEWGVDPEKVGIMGFSAGGHLASTAGTHFRKTHIENPENINLRPDFMVLVYPVISGDTTVMHPGSFKKLLGEDASAEKIDEYSNELQVTPQTPPTFLVHASDDEGVRSENSIVFYQALVKNKVPAELHIYQSGGHGFGLNNSTTQDAWMERCRNWLNSNGLLVREKVVYK